MLASDKQPWLENALCVAEGTPTSVFFPEQHQPLDDVIKAVERCVGACMVREQCLQYALDNHEGSGYFGGVSERGRRKIRRLGMTAGEYIKSDGGSDVIKRGRPAKSVQ